MYLWTATCQCVFYRDDTKNEPKPLLIRFFNFMCIECNTGLKDANISIVNHYKETSHKFYKKDIGLMIYDESKSD